MSPRSRPCAHYRCKYGPSPRRSRRRGGDGASDAPSTLKTARRGTFARALRRRCPRGGVRSVLGNRRRRRRRRRHPSANDNPTPRRPPATIARATWSRGLPRSSAGSTVGLDRSIMYDAREYQPRANKLLCDDCCSNKQGRQYKCII